MAPRETLGLYVEGRMGRRRTAWRIVLALAPLPLAAVGGCNAILGNEEGVLFADAGATLDSTYVDQDAAADTVAETAPDVASDAPPSCPDSGPPVDAAPVLCQAGVFYVSPFGDDARDGCTPCTAKQTITGALAAIGAVIAPPEAGVDAGTGGFDAGKAGDAGSSPLAIHVCAGTFAEPALTLTLPVSLLGGYACDSWSRTPTYGYPSFDGTNETIVTNAASQQDSDTLRISGAAVGAAIVVDGFTFKGSTSSTAGRAALRVEANAAPVISNNQILGGSASASDAVVGASNGVILLQSTAELTLNLVEGGSGTNTAGFGSVAVWVGQGSASIRGNTIQGGSGHGTSVGSLGIYSTASLVGTAAIAMNRVDGGTGAASQSGGAATVGIEFAQPTQVLQNRVFAGAPSGQGGAYGIKQDTGPSSVIANNMVLAGPGASSYPISLGGQGPLVAYNTVFGGARADGTFAGQINIHGGAAAVVQDNLLLGNGVANSAGIVVDACVGDVQAIQHNAFANNYHGTYAVNGAGSGCYANWTSGDGQAVSAMQTSLANIGVTTGGNMGLESDCPNGQTYCAYVAACSNVPGPGDAGGDPTSACMSALVASWSAADQGKTDLFGAGWTLPATDPCPLLAGGMAESQIKNDLYGTTRPAAGSISIGAYQIPMQPASCP